MTTAKTLRDSLRAHYVRVLMDAMSDEDVLLTNSNEFAFPVVDEANNEHFIVVTVKVPTGSRDGEPYDGYAMAKEYELKCAERERKNAERAEAKKRKMARDAEMRKAKAEKGD